MVHLNLLNAHQIQRMTRKFYDLQFVCADNLHLAQAVFSIRVEDGLAVWVEGAGLLLACFRVRLERLERLVQFWAGFLCVSLCIWVLLWFFPSICLVVRSRFVFARFAVRFVNFRFILLSL